MLHYRLEAAKSPLVAWSHLRVVNLNEATGASKLDELITYLHQIPATTNSAILQEKLGDLYKEKKRLSAAAEAYTTAANLDPSPLQRVRLLMEAGSLDALLGHEQQAFAAYKQLVAAAPAYPGLPHVYERLIPIARTLGKTNELEKFEAELKRLSPAPPPQKQP